MRNSVTAYSTATASLTLEHLYPEGTNVVVSVDVQLLLQTLEPGITMVGEWVNVIGYVVEQPNKGRRGKRSDAIGACVQALVMWPTGPLDIQRYEATFEGERSGL